MFGREIGHEIDADDAALVGDRRDRGVGDVARMVVDARAPVWLIVSGRFREGDRLVDRPGAAMGEVEQQLFGLDPADRVAAEIGEARIPRLDRTVAAEVREIVGELDGADAAFLHLRETVERGADHRRVLRSEDDAELARRACTPRCRRPSRPASAGRDWRGNSRDSGRGSSGTAPSASIWLPTGSIVSRTTVRPV